MPPERVEIVSLVWPFRATRLVACRGCAFELSSGGNPVPNWNLAHVQARHALGLDPRVDPVRQGEPLFADEDTRQHKNLRRFLFIRDHRAIPYEQKTL
jgi:hypothetical protein